MNFDLSIMKSRFFLLYAHKILKRLNVINQMFKFQVFVVLDYE